MSTITPGLRVPSPRPGRRGPWGAILDGLTYYLLTGVVVVLGLALSPGLVKSPKSGYKFAYQGEIFANWDGQWYKKIAVEGYDAPMAYQSVAFFPAYPLLGRMVAALTGVRTEVALIIVSQACLVLAFSLTAAYVRLRYADSPPALARFVLLAMGLVPTSFFFRMAYSESLFLALTVSTLYAIARRWPEWVVALIIAPATATRSVGVGLIPVLFLYIWRRSPSPRAFALRAALLTPIACWGLLNWVTFQALAFDDPIAFVHAQVNWRARPLTSPTERLVALATLEPIRAVYNPDSPGYWGGRGATPSFDHRVVDPLYFLAAVALVVLGAARRWLSGYELLTAASLLLIPYMTTGYEQYMRSMGRFAASAVPVYFVLGHLLYRAPAPLAAGIAGLSACLLGLSTALFAAWYLVI